MWVRLTRKLAECLDGIDVSQRCVGDVFELPSADAELLVAEQWAEQYSLLPQAEHSDQRYSFLKDSSPAEASLPETLDGLRRIAEQIDRRRFPNGESRRAEDRLREELRDERATTIKLVEHNSADSDE
jgi:hypothetical protein